MPGNPASRPGLACADMFGPTTGAPPDGPARHDDTNRRRIVDFARANAFCVGEAGLDLDKAIDEAIALAIEARERRSVQKDG